MFDEKTSQMLEETKKARMESESQSQEAQIQAKMTTAIIQAISVAVDAIIEHSDTATKKVTVENPSKSISTPDVMKIVPPIKSGLEAIQSTLRGNRPDADQTNKLLGDIHDVLVELPTEHPKPMPFPKKLDVKVTNPYKDPKELKNITKAIKAQKTEFKPKIEVMPTPVTVKEDSKAVVAELKKLKTELKKFDITIPEVDNTKLIKKMNEVVKAVNSIRIPIPPTPPGKVKVVNPDGTWLGGAGASADYATKVTVDGNYTYVAEATPGTAQSAASWRARRVYAVGDDTTVTWADGDNDFNNVATDLTALTYS